MAYQNVGTPRFFIDHGLWLYTIGVYTPEDDQLPFIQLNPSNVIEFPSSPVQGYVDVPNIASINYIAFLGTGNSNIGFFSFWSNGMGSNYSLDGFKEIINMNGEELPEEFNGFSIGEFTASDTYPYLRGIAEGGVNCGAVSIGSTYDMPRNPNLSLKIGIEYGGIDEITTINGDSMSNTMWSKAPMWGDLGAWELSYPDNPHNNQKLSRTGRRTWDLKFSYIDDGDLFPKYSSLTTIGTDDMPVDITTGAYAGETPESFQYTLLGSEDTDGDGVFEGNFFSEVWHKTLGGTLPFIFQPDKNNNNPDQFAICKFINSSLKATQSAHNVYDISLKIEEVW